MLIATRLPDSDVVRLDYDDGLDEAAMHAARMTIEAVVDERGRVRLLAVVGTLGRITVGGLREDLKQFGEVRHIDRIALVTDTTWMRLAAKAEARVLGFELRAFSRRAEGEALAWLTA